MSHETPYEVYERTVGHYNPDNPPSPPFSVWMSEQKAKYFSLFPDRQKNQIDGHMYSAELKRFFAWIANEH